MTLPRPFAQPPGSVVSFTAVEQYEAERSFLGRRQQLLDQLERRVVGPVQVVEYETKRPIQREPAAELGEELERLALDCLSAGLAKALAGVRLQLEPEQAAEKGIRRIGVVAEESPELGLELESRARLRGVSADAEPLSEEVADRVVGKALRV